MSFSRSRMRRLEERSRSEARCPECGLSADGLGYIRYAHELEPDEPERCSRCGRALYFVIEIGEAEEGKPSIEFIDWGGGILPNEQMRLYQSIG